MQVKIDQLSKIIWGYMLLNEEPRKSDGIFCLGSHDIRVAARAAELFLGGYSGYLVFSGGLGRITKNKFQKSEAQVFADKAAELGVPVDKILVEDKSTNTSENILFTYNLLIKERLPFKSLILVQKPYMERRTFATFKKQWPDQSTSITVTSPKLSFEDYISKSEDYKTETINIMVGDLQRIKLYPSLGYQIIQKIPSNVWQAYEELVAIGFDKYVINEPTV